MVNLVVKYKERGRVVLRADMSPGRIIRAHMRGILSALKMFIGKFPSDPFPDDSRRMVEPMQFGRRVGTYCLIGRFPYGVWVWVSMN